MSRDSGINLEKLTQSLNLVNTPSPSYLILSSIEASIEFLNSVEGRQNVDELLNNIEEIKSFLKMNLDINFLGRCETKNELQVCITSLPKSIQTFTPESPWINDPTKIFLGLNDISGNDLADILFKKFNVEFELNNNKGALALTGIGTTRRKLEKLAFSLIKAEKILQKSQVKETLTPLIEPEVIYSPSDAFYKKSKKMEILKSVGLISKETIVNYPPGIPLVIAGEIIKPEHLEFLTDRNEIDVVLD